MKFIGGLVIFLVAIYIFMQGFFPSVSGVVRGLRTFDTSDNVTVITAAGETAANVTLLNDLYQSEITEVTGLVSSNMADMPVAASYDEDTKRLGVSGLVAGATRTLAIDYTAETTDTQMRLLGPFLILIIMGIVCYFTWRIAFK